MVSSRDLIKFDFWINEASAESICLFHHFFLPSNFPFFGEIYLLAATLGASKSASKRRSFFSLTVRGGETHHGSESEAHMEFSVH